MTVAGHGKPRCVHALCSRRDSTETSTRPAIRPRCSKKAFSGHEAVMTGHRPEIVRGEHGDRCQHAETAGAQPHPASENHQRGAAEFDHDGRSGPEPRGLKAEMRLLGDGRREIDELLDPADQEGRDQRNPRDRQKPWPRKDRRDPARSVGLRHASHTAQQAQPSAPQKLLRSETGSLPDQARA